MSHWQEIIRNLVAPQHRVRIAVVGKYIGLNDAYKSVYEAVIHGGVANDCGVEIEKVDSEEIEKLGPDKMLKGLVASWCQAALANAASKAKSWPPNMPGRNAFLTWACVWACKSPPSNSPATCSNWKRRIQPNSIRIRRIRSLPCWTSRRK